MSKSARLVLYISASIFFAGAGAALWAVAAHGSHLSWSPSDRVSYADFLGIILTALGVMIAVLTVFLGVLAVIGWATFEDRIKSSAEMFLEKRFSDDDDRYNELIEEIREDVVNQAMKGVRLEYDEENDSTFDEDVV